MLKRKMNQNMLKLFVVPLVLFGLPSFLLVLRLWLNRRKITVNSDWSDIPRQTAVLFLFTYFVRWALIALFWIKPTLQWLMGWVAMWPVIGLLLGVAGLVMVATARKNEKAILLVSNLLFLALSISSIIAPN